MDLGKIYKYFCFAMAGSKTTNRIEIIKMHTRTSTYSNAKIKKNKVNKTVQLVSVEQHVSIMSECDCRLSCQ